jgi:transposase
MLDNHPLRSVRKMVNAALKKIEQLLSCVYAAGIRSGRPNIGPEKRLRAMTLQIFVSICSGRLLIEQTQHNLLFRRFMGLAMDDSVAVPNVISKVISKKRERLITDCVVFELFKEVLAIASNNDWPRGERFSLDVPLIQSWAGHNRFARKGG